MFQIKICGLTRSEDVAAVQAAGADAIGLNFYSRSKRFLSADQAASLLAGGRHGLQVIGVFVNAATDEILEIAEACQLDWIQLHGDEPPEQIRQLAPWPVIRALPYGDAGLAPIRAHLDACDGAGRLPAALLLDAAAPGMYGGTGKPLPWQRLAKELPVRDALPWILAGGLTPVNVKQAIELLNPDAVDTASGVESSPGEKNAQLTRDFVAAVRQASSGDGR